MNHWKIESLLSPLPRFTNEWQNLLLKIKRIILNIFRKTNTSVTSILFYGGPIFSAELNTNILNSSIDYILSTKTPTYSIHLLITYFLQKHQHTQFVYWLHTIYKKAWICSLFGTCEKQLLPITNVCKDFCNKFIILRNVLVKDLTKIAYLRVINFYIKLVQSQIFLIIC